MNIRIIDLIVSVPLLIISLPILIILFILGFFDTGSPLFAQQRVGKNKKLFVLFKFRTMKVNTKSVGSHLVKKDAVTRLGKLLRKFKLDELPQLINVVKGDMSLVGPRPCLPNQIEVISYRDKKNVFNVKPGITGLAQITGVDMSTPELLAKRDEEMITTMSITKYFKYLFLTFIGKGKGDRVNY